MRKNLLGPPPRMLYRIDTWVTGDLEEGGFREAHRWLLRQEHERIIAQMYCIGGFYLCVDIWSLVLLPFT